MWDTNFHHKLKDVATSASPYRDIVQKYSRARMDPNPN